MKQHAERSARYWFRFKLIIGLVLVIVAARIGTVTSPESDTAFLSANDRSRWCTVACLVQHGTYAIDPVLSIRSPENPRRHPWQTIDKVWHRDASGEMRYYSSKPPLLATVVAGVYWLVHTTSGLTMTEHPIWLPRIILWLVNLPLLGICLWSMTSVIDQICRAPWAKYVGVLTACFGTMLVPFSVSLSNHLPAAAALAVAVAIYFHVAETLDDEFGTSRTLPRALYLTAGLAIGSLAACELPALSMAVLLTGLFYLLEKKSLLPLLCGFAIVAVAFFGTNFWAHRSLRPPYAHRGNGPVIATVAKQDFDGPVTQPESLPEFLLRKFPQTFGNDDKGMSAEQIRVSPSDEPGRFRVVTQTGEFALLDQDNRWELTVWDDWYEYPGSYWQQGRRRGVDTGEPSRLIYLFHMTFGHHGIFSLTPVFLLVPFGLVRLCKSGPPDLTRFAFVVALTSAVCVTFYVLRPLIDRNYGGVSVCFRWLLWLIPAWTPLVAATLDAHAHRGWFRVLVIALVVLSVASMTWALPNPWRSPWLYSTAANGDDAASLMVATVSGGQGCLVAGCG